MSASGAAHVVADADQVIDGGGFFAVFLLEGVVGHLRADDVLADVEVFQRIVHETSLTHTYMLYFSAKYSFRLKRFSASTRILGAR